MRALSSSLALVALFAVAAAACNGALLPLGSDDAGLPDVSHPDASRPDVSQPTPTMRAPSCPFIGNDSEYGTLRGDTCVGHCSDSLEPERDASLPAMVEAMLTGSWTYCSGALGPDAATGIQFDVGCTFFFLEGDAGQAVPGNATYDVVYDGAGSATGILLHLPTGDVQADVTASSCLGRARLTTDGGVIELASLVPTGVNPAK